jgi:hypothetical protein
MKGVLSMYSTRQTATHKNRTTPPMRIPVVYIPYVERQPILDRVAALITNQVRQTPIMPKEKEYIHTLLVCLRRRQDLPVSMVEDLFFQVKEQPEKTPFIISLYVDVLECLNAVRHVLEDEWLGEGGSLSQVPHPEFTPRPTPQQPVFVVSVLSHHRDQGQNYIQRSILRCCPGPDDIGLCQADLVSQLRRRLDLPFHEVILEINTLIEQGKLSKDPSSHRINRRFYTQLS